MSNPQTTPAKRLNAVQRRIRVLEMTQAGQTVREIGAALGVSHGTAWNDLKRALKEYADQQTVETATLRALEQERLEQLHDAVWPKALAGNVNAVEAVLAVMTRRAKLLGLDVPVRVDLSAEVAFHIEEALNTLEQILPKEHYKKALEALANAA